MFAFKTLAAAATIAFGALSAIAAPVAETNELAARQVDVAATAGIAVIIQATTEALVPAVAELSFITSANATVEVLTPIVANISATLTAAISDVNALRGQPAAVILAGVDGSARVSVQVAASLIADLINTVFVGLGVVLNVAGPNVSVVLSLLASVGGLVGTLVTAVLSVAGGLLFGLVPAVLILVGDVLSIIARLRVTALINLGLRL